MERQREITSDKSVRAALQEQLLKTEEAYAKHDAQKKNDPDPLKGRDR
jgi:benzoyl-CoA reductase/2-hydroxyglutaryl-CoA dehydratase subunit BcrC/BadD/HgdB